MLRCAAMYFDKVKRAPLDPAHISFREDSEVFSSMIFSDGIEQRHIYQQDGMALLCSTVRVIPASVTCVVSRCPPRLTFRKSARTCWPADTVVPSTGKNDHFFPRGSARQAWRCFPGNHTTTSDRPRIPPTASGQLFLEARKGNAVPGETVNSRDTSRSGPRPAGRRHRISAAEFLAASLSCM